MKKKKSVYLGLFTILIFICFYTQNNVYGGIFDWFKKPELTEEQKEWKTFNRNVDTDDPNYPLEVLSDGYKMIRAYRTEAREVKGTKIPAEDRVEWGWKMTIKNKSIRKIKVYVEYILKDQDGFKVAYGNTNIEETVVYAGDTITIQEKTTMPYENVNRVSTSGWTIKLY
jgi:hypothetical protein